MIVRGIGATTPQLIATTGQAASGAFAAALPVLAPIIGITGPVGLAIAGAVAGVTALLGAFGVGGGCGQSCIQASNDANAIEQAMKQNLAQFQAGQIDQATAEANFQSLWAQLEQSCGAIGGDAGKNCIGDRQAGACKWKDASGNCFNWFSGYYDPIASVAPAVSPASFSGMLPILGIGLAAWAIAEAL